MLMEHEELEDYPCYHYLMHNHKEPDGTWIVSIPALEGCVVKTKTLGEAVKILPKKIWLWIEQAKKEGREIPAEDGYTAPPMSNAEYYALCKEILGKRWKSE